LVKSSGGGWPNENLIRVAAKEVLAATIGVGLSENFAEILRADEGGVPTVALVFGVEQVFSLGFGGAPGLQKILVILMREKRLIGERDANGLAGV